MEIERGGGGRVLDSGLMEGGKVKVGMVEEYGEEREENVVDVVKGED